MRVFHTSQLPSCSLSILGIDVPTFVATMVAAGTTFVAVLLVLDEAALALPPDDGGGGDNGDEGGDPDILIRV